MISLLIGAFLIGGIIQIFISTRQTNLMEEELAKLQENGRFAMESLARDIRMTDYRDINCVGPIYAYPALNFPLAGVDNDPGSLPGTDSIQIRWIISPCPTGAFDANDGNVTYLITNDAAVSPRNLRRTGQDVITGVDNFQIQYGVDTDANGTPDYYGTAATVPAATMLQVVSIRINLLLRSEDNITSQPVPYAFMGTTFPSADRRIRREFFDDHSAS
ncbi:MAG: PilW family protein [Methylococcaceae bacterium]|nr:PilW family protein [Methylococcaceae bacterium]